MMNVHQGTFFFGFHPHLWLYK